MCIIDIHGWLSEGLEAGLNMAEIVEVERKSAVLKRPSLPCLNRYHTINLASGCLFGCRYCYARSFRSHPGHDNISFYSNTYEMLERELPRKRDKPELVYFSTACDPFMPEPKILECVFKTMRLLLKNSISILVSTKGHIPNKFLELFAQHTDKVRVQMGITTFNDEVRQIMEPNAASVAERLDSMQRLVELGISVEARMDPLIPELSDTDESFGLLCTQLQRIGIKKAVVSYLYLREHNRWPLNIKLDNWSFSDMAKRLYTHKIENYCSGGSVRISRPDYRKAKYARLKQIAAGHQITLGFCTCKNPDLTDEYCFAQPATRPIQTSLF